MNSSPPTNNGPASDDTRPPQHDNADAPSPKQHGKKSKTLWVTVFRCFHCGKHGHNLPKCRQCSQAYYCDADCQRKHWKKHRPVCRAAVAALARHAHRLRVARAVREKGKKQEKAGGADNDNLCVICQAKPVDPVEVIAYLYDSRIIFPSSHDPILHIGSCRVATSTASHVFKSCARKAWTNRAPSAASRCRLGQRSCSIWGIACMYRSKAKLIGTVSGLTQRPPGQPCRASSSAD